MEVEEQLLAARMCPSRSKFLPLGRRITPQLSQTVAPLMHRPLFRPNRSAAGLDHCPKVLGRGRGLGHVGSGIGKVERPAERPSQADMRCASRMSSGEVAGNMASCPGCRVDRQVRPEQAAGSTKSSFDLAIDRQPSRQAWQKVKIRGYVTPPVVKHDLGTMYLRKHRAEMRQKPLGEQGRAG